MHFEGEELLAPCPTPKLEHHPLSAVLHCLFNIFAATLRNGGRSSIRNLRTRRQGPTYHGHYKWLPLQNVSLCLDTPSGSRSPLCWCIAVTLKNTRTILSRTALDKWWARRRDLYLTTQRWQEILISRWGGGVRTRNARKRAVADPRLRQRGHWLWHLQRLSIEAPK